MAEIEVTAEMMKAGLTAMTTISIGRVAADKSIKLFGHGWVAEIYRAMERARQEESDG